MTEFDDIAADLHARGFSIRPAFLSGAAVAALCAEAGATAAEFRAAGIGRDRDLQRDDAIRSDRIRWLDPQQPAQADFLAGMDALRVAINRQLWLGLHDYEAHFARYAPGAFYRRHRDAFANADDGKPRRALSSVIYLNQNWEADAGGELVLYDAAERELTRVLPAAGTAIFFLSEEFPHEVLAATRERLSIAGWFRRRG